MGMILYFKGTKGVIHTECSYGMMGHFLLVTTHSALCMTELDQFSVHIQETSNYNRQFLLFSAQLVIGAVALAMPLFSSLSTV